MNPAYVICMHWLVLNPVLAEVFTNFRNDFGVPGELSEDALEDLQYKLKVAMEEIDLETSWLPAFVDYALYGDEAYPTDPLGLYLRFNEPEQGWARVLVGPNSTKQDLLNAWNIIEKHRKTKKRKPVSENFGRDHFIFTEHFLHNKTPAQIEIALEQISGEETTQDMVRTVINRGYERIKIQEKYRKKIR